MAQALPLKSVGFTSNADYIRAAADYLAETALQKSSPLNIAFYPGQDAGMVSDLAQRTDSNAIAFRTLKLEAGANGEFSQATLFDGDQPETGIGETQTPVFLVLKHAFYGISRARSADLLASLPAYVRVVLIIDQIDNFAAAESSVLSLLDNGARPYEAECHDFGNLLRDAGFAHAFALHLPDPVKSLSGLILASRDIPLSQSHLVTHCASFVEKMALQRRKAVNETRKARVRATKAPRRLIIEPSSQCNFMCPKCVYPIMERTKGLIDIQKLSAFLTTWKAEIGTFEAVDLTGSGDVLVNKQFPEIIRLFTDIMPTAKVTATTNLALLNETTADALLDAGLRYWQVSFDSADEDEFHRFTKSKKYRAVLDNIKMLYAKMQARADGPFDLTIVAHRPFDEHYESGMQAIRDLLKDHSHAISCTPYQSLNGRIAGEIYRASEKQFYDKSVSTLVCNYLWDDLVVVHTGDVRVCCSDMFDSKINFGNVFRDTPQEIIANHQRAHYQARMMEGAVDELYLCKDCHAPYAPV